MAPRCRGSRALWLLLGLLIALAKPADTAHADDEGTSRPSPRSITLAEALERAQRDPPRVLAARARLEQGRAALAVARGQYAPSLSLDASAGLQRLDNHLAGSGTSESDGSRAYQGRALLVADWALVDPARRSRVDAASHTRDARQQSYAAEQLDALRAAVDLFVRARFASRLVSDAELSVSRRERQQRAIAGLVTAGLRPKVDAARAEVEAIAVRRRLQGRRIERDAAYAALAAAVGSDPLEPLRPVDYAVSPFDVPADPEQAVALALSQRPELRERRQQLRAREAQRRTARRELSPVVGVAGSGDYLRTRPRVDGRDPRVDEMELRGMAYLRWEVLDVAAWKRRSLARAGESEAEAELQRAMLDIRQQVVGAALQLQAAENELARASEVLDVAATIRVAQNGRYETGVASLLELLDAEAVEQNARIARIEAERGVEQARAALMFTCGSLPTARREGAP